MPLIIDPTGSVQYYDVIALERGYLHALPNAPLSTGDIVYRLYELCRRRGVPMESIYAHYSSNSTTETVEYHPPSEVIGRIHMLGAYRSSGLVSIDTYQALGGAIPSGSSGASPFIGGIVSSWQGNQFGVYIGSWLPFDKIEVKVLAAGGSLYAPWVVLIPSSIDANGTVSSWREVGVLENTTVVNNVPFQQTGYIRIDAPLREWRRAKLPIAINCPPFDTSDKLPMYWVRIFAAWMTAPPVIVGWRLDPWAGHTLQAGYTNHYGSWASSKFAATSNPSVSILGWNPSLDTDGDGFLNDTERSAPGFSSASAVFHHQARVSCGFQSCLARNADEPVSFSLIRYWDPQVRELLAELYAEHWMKGEYTGHGFEDVNVTVVGVHSVTLRDDSSGYNVNSTQWRDAQPQQLEELAKNIRRKRASHTWTGAVTTTSSSNLLSPTATGMTARIRANFDILVRRKYCMEYTGLFGQLGFCRLWDHFVDAATLRTGHDNMHALHCAIALPISMGNTSSTWARSKITCAAQYLLRHVPNFTFGIVWPEDIGNLDGLTSTSNYYKSGVPYAMAYYPYKVFGVDIGIPTGIPNGYYALPLVHPDSSTSGNVVGSTSGNSVTVESNNYPIVPSNVFLLYPQSSYSGQTDVVIARAFTNGLAILRVRDVSDSAPDSTYLNSTINVTLPGAYQVVSIDGSLGAPMTYVSIYGAQGLILKKV